MSIFELVGLICAGVYAVAAYAHGSRRYRRLRDLDQLTPKQALPKAIAYGLWMPIQYVLEGLKNAVAGKPGDK